MLNNQYSLGSRRNLTSFILKGGNSIDFSSSGVNQPVNQSAHLEGCACNTCQGMPVDGTVKWSIDSTRSTTFGSIQKLADYLNRKHAKPYYWDLSSSGHNGELTYDLNGTSHYNDNNGIIPGWRPGIRAAFDIYEEILGIKFTEVDSENADIAFTDNKLRNGGPDASAGWSYWSSGEIGRSRINITPDWNGGPSSSVGGDYGFQTIIHEIGHVLGLGHQGNYNGTGNFSTQAVFANDSWQMSVMSYFSQTTNPNTNSTRAYIPTLMTADLVALDDKYSTYGKGISNAFNGDTTYGFNTNISAKISEIYSNMKNLLSNSAITIVDADGIDTIDFSGFSKNQTICSNYKN